MAPSVFPLSSRREQHDANRAAVQSTNMPGGEHVPVLKLTTLGPQTIFWVRLMTGLVGFR